MLDRSIAYSIPVHQLRLDDQERCREPSSKAPCSSKDSAIAQALVPFRFGKGVYFVFPLGTTRARDASLTSGVASSECLTRSTSTAFDPLDPLSMPTLVASVITIITILTWSNPHSHQQLEPHPTPFQVSLRRATSEVNYPLVPERASIIPPRSHANKTHTQRVGLV